MKSLAADGDAQSCQFETAAFALVTVTLRPGLGNATVGVGGAPGASVAADVVENRLGDLCNTVFAKQ